jgi:prevent-host-death family protein
MTVTASNLKQHFHLLDEARREPLSVTKRGRPYVVVLDHETYRQLKQGNINNTQDATPTLHQKLDALLEQQRAFESIDDPVAWQREQRNEW